MIKSLFYNELIKLYHDSYLKVLVFVTLILGLGMFTYSMLLSIDSFSRISKVQPAFLNPFFFFEFQWKGATSLGLIPLDAFIVWVIFGVEDRHSGWRNICQLPVPIKSVVTVKLSLVLFIKGIIFLMLAVMYFLNIDLLMNYRKEFGFYNFNYSHALFIQDLIKVYLTSLSIFIMVIPLYTYIKNLGVLTIVPLSLAAIPLKYNPLKMFYDHPDFWYFGIIGIAGVILFFALSFYLQKRKACFLESLFSI